MRLGSCLRVARRIDTQLRLDLSDDGEHPIVVKVAGSISANRADELWTTVERALEQAADRTVVIDLSDTTSFDAASTDCLARLARDSARRGRDICAVVRPDSSLSRYAQRSLLPLLLPIHSSMPEF